MKIFYYVFLIVFFILNGDLLQAQDERILSKDTAAIAFKAKLLALSNRGLSDEQSILDDLEGQPIDFIETGSENILLMRVTFDQTYYQGDTHSAVVLFPISATTYK